MDPHAAPELDNDSRPDDSADPLLSLTPAQRAAFLSLQAGARVEDAAKAGGCSRATLFRWKRSATWKAAEAVYRAEAVREDLDRLARIRSVALDIVERTLDRVKADPGAEISPPLLRVLEMALDRTGLPKQTSVAVAVAPTPDPEQARFLARLNLALGPDGTVVDAPPAFDPADRR